MSFTCPSIDFTESAALILPCDTCANIWVTIDIKEDMGAEVYLHFAVDAAPVTADELREIVGAEALEAADEQTHHHGSPFVARVERGAQVREGEKARLAVDTSRLHFFDLDSGESLAGAADRALAVS